MDEKMNELFSGLKKIPDDFFDWINQDDERGNLIYYKKNGRHADYYCCQCGKQYRRRIIRLETAVEDMIPQAENNPKRYELETCKECGKIGRLEWKKCAGIARIARIWNQNRYFIWQTDMSGNLVIREFYRRTIRELGKEKQTKTYEIFRAFLAPGMVKEYDYTEYSKKWNETRRNITKDYERIGAEYGDIREAIAESKMKYFKIEEYVKIYQPDASYRMLNSGVRVETMIVCARTPVIEMIHKIGMDELAREIIRDHGTCRLIYKNGKTIEKVLRVKKEDIKWIMQQDNQIAALRTCQTIRKSRWKITQNTRDDIYKMVFQSGMPGRIESMLEILKFMSIEQAKNRIEKYKQEYNELEATTIQEYADYLKMRNGLGYDMTNEIYLKPRELIKTYKKLQEEEKAKRDELYIKRMMEKYPKISNRFKELNKKYFYEDDEFLIRPARDAGEIVLEGRTLHHCVGSSSQGYMGNHNNGKRFILFLRKRSKPDVPYITVEIDKNFKVQQWYGKNDQKPDKKKIDKWMEIYIQEKTKVKEKKKAS